MTSKLEIMIDPTYIQLAPVVLEMFWGIMYLNYWTNTPKFIDRLKTHLEPVTSVNFIKSNAWADWRISLLCAHKKNVLVFVSRIVK